ncbi:MAG: hypothetical protein HGA82_03530 [Anaerolineales bacterium]|nr:hypothetical protein [Anaerolineales bacterium]
MGRGLIHAANHDDEVIIARSFGFGNKQVALSQDFLVGLGAHDDSGVENAGLLCQGAL